MADASKLPRDGAYFSEKLCQLGRSIRDAVVAARDAHQSFADVSRQTSADTIYELDTHVEPILEEFCRHWSRDFPLTLIAEGVEGDDGEEGEVTFPEGAEPEEAAFQLIVDPIDGTRGLMYDKRAAWVLAGVAPNRGVQTCLSDIAVAMQTEVPTSKQTRSDVLWAVRGQGAHGVRDDLITGRSEPLKLGGSHATTITHGFGTISSFFPGTKILSAELMEMIVRQLIGEVDTGKALVFDDQYISTGGQFYELMVGHDRFNADLRSLFYRALKLPPGLCVHPYDVASALIAREAGVLITNGVGGMLDGPLDVTTSLSWAGFANANLRQQIEPIITKFLSQFGLGSN